jgi:hypothetical protein
MIVDAQFHGEVPDEGTPVVCVFVAPLLMLVVGGAFSVVGTSAASAAPHFGNTFGNSFGRPGHPSGSFGGFFGPTYICTGGNIPPGTYNSMIIGGECYMPAGTISIRGALFVAPGALLDAATPGDPGAGPVVPATLSVGGSVAVGSGAVLILGSSPNILFSVGNTPGQPQLESFPSSLHRHAWHDVDGTPGRHLYEVRIEMRRGPGAGAGPVNANLTVSVSS